jgi:hypothetical protein
LEHLELFQTNQNGTVAGGKIERGRRGANYLGTRSSHLFRHNVGMQIWLKINKLSLSALCSRRNHFFCAGSLAQSQNLKGIGALKFTSCRVVEQRVQVATPAQNNAHGKIGYGAPEKLGEQCKACTNLCGGAFP